MEAEDYKGYDVGEYVQIKNIIIMTECERIIQKGIVSRDFLKEEVRCDFFVDRKRKELWGISLDMLAEFDKVCKK